MPTGDCDGGWYCTTGATVARPTLTAQGGRCTVGNFCPNGSSAETPCSPGMYCDNVGEWGEDLSYYQYITCTVESVDFVVAQCSLKFVSKTHQVGYEVIFPYACVRENMKLLPMDLQNLIKQSMKIGLHKFE